MFGSADAPSPLLRISTVLGSHGDVWNEFLSESLYIYSRNIRDAHCEGFNQHIRSAMGVAQKESSDISPQGRA